MLASVNDRVHNLICSRPAVTRRDEPKWGKIGRSTRTIWKIPPLVNTPTPTVGDMIRDGPCCPDSGYRTTDEHRTLITRGLCSFSPRWLDLMAHQTCAASPSPAVNWRAERESFGCPNKVEDPLQLTLRPSNPVDPGFALRSCGHCGGSNRIVANTS